MDIDLEEKTAKILDVIFALPISSWKFIERGFYQTAINGIVINLRFTLNNIGQFEVDPPQYLYLHVNKQEDSIRMAALIKAIKKNESQTLVHKVDYIFETVVK